MKVIPASALPSSVVRLASASALTATTRACASPLVTWTAASALPASLTRSASACASAIRASLSPSARFTCASASASAGRIVLAMSSFCVRSACELRQLGLLAHDLLLGRGLGKRSGLGGLRLRGGRERLDLGLAEGDVTLGVELDLLRLGLPDGGLLVGGGLGHPRVALAAGRLLLPDQVHVADFVADRLDREVVDREAGRRQVALGGALDLLLELLAVVVELLHGERADDRAERPLEDVLHDRLDLILAVDEPLGGVADRLVVATDLDRRDALDRALDALLGDGIGQVHVDLAGREVEPSELVDQRQDHDASGSDDLELCRGAHQATGPDQRLVRPGDLEPARDVGDQEHQDDEHDQDGERAAADEVRGNQTRLGSLRVAITGPGAGMPVSAPRPRR